VVEARNVEGFFGFDRVREISRQPARTIANTAQQFGQEDDITVLTLLFTTSGWRPCLNHMRSFWSQRPVLVVPGLSPIRK
jgi:hypothetical protein